MESTAEKEWVSHAKSGDIHAFGLLANKYAKQSFSLAFGVLKDYHNANDAVQDAMISAFENIRKFKEEAKFSTWLYRIVWNSTLQYAKRKIPMQIDDVSPIADYEEEWDFPAENLAEKLPTAMAQLNENERIVLEMYYYKELKIKDISEITGASEANIKVILYRSRKKLELLLQKNP